MAVTLKDIAKECGVAVSTVSNILNNHATSFASEEVRLKVRQTVERLGYKKDYLSASLRTRTTRSIGLILDQIDDLTRQDFLVPFVGQFSALGYEVALAEHRRNASRAVASLEGFADRYKDGVILFTDLLGQPNEDEEKLWTAVEASSLKVLGIGSRFRGRIPSLDIDRGRAVEASLKHFFARGRQSILVVHEYDWDMRPQFSFWEQPGITYWGGTHTVQDFLRRAEAADWSQFDAVFFRTDRIAIPALRYFEGHGIRVPDDLEIISFDNYRFSEDTNPALTTWDIGFQRLGSRAQELMSAWLKGDEPAPDHYELFLPVWMPRQSHQGDL